MVLLLVPWARILLHLLNRQRICLLLISCQGETLIQEYENRTVWNTLETIGIYESWRRATTDEDAKLLAGDKGY